MTFSQPVQEIIRARYSCRTYRPQPLPAVLQERLSAFLTTVHTGPFGTSPRFRLAAAAIDDPRALKELGTYGFIKGAPAYIISAVRKAHGNLEDLGYLLERIVLYATDLGLGTCWLGGTFTQSSFARRIEVQDGERVPAVTPVGYPAGRPRVVDGIIRQSIGADKRLPWQRLFFDGEVDRPLTPEMAGSYATPLEMVRLGPSATNRQPWRVVRTGNRWHFYLLRSRVGGLGSMGRRVPRPDLQRIDLGIAMSHFELTADEMGLNGEWEFRRPQVAGDRELDYTATWVAT